MLSQRFLQRKVQTFQVTTRLTSSGSRSHFFWSTKASLEGLASSIYNSITVYNYNSIFVTCSLLHLWWKQLRRHDLIQASINPPFAALSQADSGPKYQLTSRYIMVYIYIYISTPVQLASFNNGSLNHSLA